MALIKLSNNGVKNITSVGSVSTGDLVFISKQTASSSASISFTSGIDSTYKEYIFYFVNIHPGSADSYFSVNFRDGGSNYDATKTTTNFRAQHGEDGSGASLDYQTGNDLAQSTSDQRLSEPTGNQDADKNLGGYLHLFNPSSTTFVKHFMARTSNVDMSNYNTSTFVAGYCNTTTAIDGVQFKFSSGNIDAGDILLYGVN